MVIGRNHELAIEADSLYQMGSGADHRQAYNAEAAGCPVLNDLLRPSVLRVYPAVSGKMTSRHCLPTPKLPSSAADSGE